MNGTNISNNNKGLSPETLPSNSIKQSIVLLKMKERTKEDQYLLVSGGGEKGEEK